MANTFIVISKGAAYGMFNTHAAADTWARKHVSRNYKIFSVQQHSELPYRYEDLR